MPSCFFSSFTVFILFIVICVVVVCDDVGMVSVFLFYFSSFFVFVVFILMDFGVDGDLCLFFQP